MNTSSSWSLINPEERSVLTANRVNVQNQKFKKELALKQRGLEDEIKCDNIIYTRRESVMQHKLSRLSQASKYGYSRRSTPFSSGSPENWMENSRPGSNQETRSFASRGSDKGFVRAASREMTSKVSPRSPNDNLVSDERPISAEKFGRHVRFGSQALYPETTAAHMNGASRRRSCVSDAPFHGRRGFKSEAENEFGPSFTGQLPPILKYASLRNVSTKSPSSSGRNPRGFSSLGQLSNLVPRNSLKVTSGLEEEMARWRRLHHTRAINARIKAVRSGGKRHGSLMTLRETMDSAAMIRREEALHPEPFTAQKAWGLLNCGYLRLTPSNVATLENICSSAGYDVSSHPHKASQDVKKEMEEVFKELRDSHSVRPGIESQLKFRQSLLFKRISEDLPSTL